jgi:hypothetical protein
LLNCAINRHNEIKIKQESQKIRINAIGGGRPEKLSIFVNYFVLGRSNRITEAVKQYLCLELKSKV